MCYANLLGPLKDNDLLYSVHSHLVCVFAQHHARQTIESSFQDIVLHNENDDDNVRKKIRQLDGRNNTT